MTASGPSASGDSAEGSPWERLVALLRRLGASPDRARQVREVLEANHRHAWRVYHAPAHTFAVLESVDTLSEHDSCRPEHPDALELAVWFHDAVYVPGSADNEKASVGLLREQLDDVVAPDVLDRAERLVLATAGHTVEPSSPDWPDVGVLLDADLAVLAASPADYRRYTEDVREEYAFLSDDDWRRGRAGVLRQLTARPLFRTPPMREREGRARANIARELAGLESD
jgi:predicted metal-dependent HD superfamily phosphohydrolase